MRCIPFERSLTEAYLRTIQRLAPEQWSGALAATADDVTYVWRDGESMLLIPDGVAREKLWLETVGKSAERLSLSEAAGARASRSRTSCRARRIARIPCTRSPRG